MTRARWLLPELLMAMALAATSVCGLQGTNTNETQAQEFLDRYNTEAENIFAENVQAAWEFNTNITDENQAKQVQSNLKVALWQQNMSREAREFNTTGFNVDRQRQFTMIKDIGTSALQNLTKLEELNNVLSKMETIYSTAKVCLSATECLPLDPDITKIFETSREESRLRRLWLGWRSETGKKMKQLYADFVAISNEAVRTLGYDDTGAYWRSWYETPTFEEDVRRLFDELKPFYIQLHAFVRRRLREQYGQEVFPVSGQIPAHLLGNMWAQQWSSLQDLVMPYKGKPILDVTDEMVKQNYTAVRIFQVADEFFTSLGLTPMPKEFWDHSMLEKPKDGRQVVCHASAWDFYNRRDFRVKQCTEVTMEHFSTAHHEMGHVEYYLQYKHLPVVYRSGANPGFHEAVGDVISLSVETPKHLHKIGLLPVVETDNEADINFLMAMALQKIAFLPFGYLVDQWRWSVFRGETKIDSYNKKWWDLRCGLQGVSPPEPRSDAAGDFDPGAKFHIPNNTPYIRYFVSFVLQFQFHEALCKTAGHSGPLHQCDIYNSSAAGQKLHEMLSMGSSHPWPTPFFNLTGENRMSAQPLINYFKPLMDFLKARNGDDVGWKTECSTTMMGRSSGNGLSAAVFTAIVVPVALLLQRLHT